jgi:hypothetical protein
MLNIEPTLKMIDSTSVALNLEMERIEEYIEGLTFKNSASIDELEAIEKVQGQLLSLISDLRLVKTDLRVFSMNSKDFKW